MIRASTDQLEQRLQQAERSVEFTREETLLAQACKKIGRTCQDQVEHKLERVQERLVEA
jgi:tetrahydromethanopterin S-methyltransferase subunit G